LIGIDIEGDQPVTIHVDHRPFALFWEVWREAGFPQPIEYAADRLMLYLDMLPDRDADDGRLIECGADLGIANDDDRLSAREIEP